MMEGVKTNLGYSYEAPHLSSGQIQLVVGDLVTAFIKGKESENLITGKVVDLKPTFVTISPLLEGLPPVITQPQTHGFKAAYT